MALGYISVSDDGQRLDTASANNVLAFASGFRLNLPFGAAKRTERGIKKQ